MRSMGSLENDIDTGSFPILLLRNFNLGIRTTHLENIFGTHILLLDCSSARPSSNFTSSNYLRFVFVSIIASMVPRHVKLIEKNRDFRRSVDTGSFRTSYPEDFTMATPTTHQHQGQVPDAPQYQFQLISNTEPYYTFSPTPSSTPSPTSLPVHTVPATQRHPQFIPYQTSQFYNSQNTWTANKSSNQIQQPQFQLQPTTNCRKPTSPSVNQSHYSPSYQIYRYTTPRAFPVITAQYTPPHIQHPRYPHSFSPSELHQQIMEQRVRSSFPANTYPTPPPSMSNGKTSQGRAGKVTAFVEKISSSCGTKRNSVDADLEDADCDAVTEPDTSEEEPEDDDDDEYNPQSPKFGSRSSTKGTPKATPTSEVADKESGKPYAVLVYEALMSTKACSMTVSEIYDYFKKHHPHFRNVKGRGWMNSIRYNLSMNEVCENE